MIFVKLFDRQIKSKSARQPSPLPPHKNELALPLSIAACHPGIPPHSRKRALTAARRCGVRRWTVGHCVSAAAVL